MDAGDRRQLTVVFCDLVGSTELAARMDPEDWGDVVAHYHRCASDVIVGLGGHVAQYLGDGVLAYFGWPRAREDAPERAVRAGLELVTAVPALRPGPDGLHVRVGIHTGSVVVGAVGAGNEMLALGGAPNVAARVQGLAAPDTVLLTDATLELVRGAFRVEAAGAHALKGLQDPVTVHRAVASSGERSRRFTTPGARLTPFVGRAHELAILRERWAEACAGSGRVVLLQGEAGIGKSRLLGRLRQELACGPEEWIECATSAYHENTPFFAVSDLLRGLVARDATDGGARSDVLRAALARGGLAVDDALPLVAPLAAIDVPDEGSAPASPEERHRRLLATLVAWVEGLARATPVVLVVEDLHWSDPSTLEMLDTLADRGAAVPLLLVLTARPEFRLPWTPGAHHTTMALGRLPPDEARTLVERTAEGLARELVDVVVERTDGIPLFVEELTRLVAERVEALDPQAIPSTLSDSLMARLDGLGPAREIVQVGAVLGRQFAYRHLRAVLPLTEDELAARLDRLGESDLVQVQGERPDAVYRFKHALVQSTAYGSLLRGRRRDLHRAIAAALGAEPDTPPEVLARHHDEAGDLEQAVAAWKEAGERTAARGALGEAAGHYEAALVALGKLGDVPAHRARELPLRVALGQALFARKGYGSSEVADAFTRARILAAESSNPIETLPVLIGLFIWTQTRGDTATMRALVDDLTAAAESIGHRAALVWAHWAQGVACYVLGDLATAERALARAIDAYHEDDHRGRPTDPGMASLVYAALTACRLGHADTARAHVAAATDLAHRLNKTYSVAFAATFTCAVHTLLHDVDAVALLAPRAEALARENRFPIFELTGAMFQGWADAVGHGSAASIPRMRDALARYAGTGHRHMLGFYTGMLAEAEAATGDVDRALTTVRHALAEACDPIDRSALHCIEGDVLARTGADSDAPAARYADALDVARAFGAGLDELRAATRLASGLARRAKPDEARSLLVPIAAGFVEGTDTPDVRAARLLLAELA